MACRGVHFAIDLKIYEKLLSAKSDGDLIEIIQEEIEEKWDEEWLRETDKSWDAIHRCLTDGNLEWQNGSFPLNAVILGGKQLHEGDDYIVSVVPPQQVPFVAQALEKIDQATLKKGYDNIDQLSYDTEVSEEDFKYTWNWFKELPSLFSKAGESGRAIIFSVDQ